MSEATMMKCGHAANATCSKRDGVDLDPPIPSCAICSCVEPADEAPNLTGRTACCSYSHGRDGKPCTAEEPSSLSLAFFEHTPGQDHDRYYCGCWGWN